MSGPIRKTIIDIFATALVLYASFWVYELANLMVLSLAGHDASITVSFLMPAGTTSVSEQPSAPMYLKILQVLICAGVGLALVGLARTASLSFTQLTALSVIGVYLSSFYWEILPGTVTSYPLHVLTFTAMAGAVNGTLFLSARRLWHSF